MLEKLREILCQYVEMDASQITEESNLRSELNLTSLAFVNILVELEDEFDVEIDEEEALKFQTIQDIIDYLKQNGAE